MPKTVASEWKDFRKCFTMDASPTYLTEHKISFYAGALAVLSCVPVARDTSEILTILLRLSKEVRDTTKRTRTNRSALIYDILEEMKEDGRAIPSDQQD